MKTTNIDGLDISRLCLGGGKFEHLPTALAYPLIERALALGINLFDSHHRYGISEAILGNYCENPTVKIMTKVSAYKYNENLMLVKNSLQTLQRIPDIMWISDLDDKQLYNTGDKLYHELLETKMFPRLGITTESAGMGFMFLKQHPECKFFMIPYHPKSSPEMKDFALELKRQDKYVFAIKPFNDGLSFMAKPCHVASGITNTFHMIINEINPDVICFGTKNIAHCEETIKLFNDITGRMGNNGC